MTQYLLAIHNGGTVVTTDGPFAETKRQLGGFWITEAADLDAALAWAAKVTAAVGHPFEVRPFEVRPFEVRPFEVRPFEKEDEGRQADIMTEVGTLHRLAGAGDLDQATAYHHRESLDMAHEIDSSRDKAHTLAGLGRCALATGDLSGARDLLAQSRQIFEHIGAAEAVDVATELAALPLTPAR